MVGVLKDEGYITKEKYGSVNLTENGRSVAADIKKRYELLWKFFHNILGVQADTAAKDACRIEHLISSETADQIYKQLFEFSEDKANQKYNET
jgi:Mn-dependent DtxR family transcriptional regulator